MSDHQDRRRVGDRLTDPDVVVGGLFVAYALLTAMVAGLSWADLETKNHNQIEQQKGAQNHSDEAKPKANTRPRIEDRKPTDNDHRQDAAKNPGNKSQRHNGVIDRFVTWALTPIGDYAAQWLMAIASFIALAISVFALLYVRKTYRRDHRAYITDQRAWLKIESCEPGYIERRGSSFFVRLNVKITNIGKTPSTNIRYFPMLVSTVDPERVQEEATVFFDSQFEDHSVNEFGLLPGEFTKPHFAMSMDLDDMEIFYENSAYGRLYVLVRYSTIDERLTGTTGVGFTLNTDPEWQNLIPLDAPNFGSKLKLHRTRSIGKIV